MNKEVTRNDFEQYLYKYCDFISILKQANGVHFMDIMGWDGGDLKKDCIEDGNIKYSDLDAVDKFLQDAYEEFKEDGASKPKITFKEFINNGESKA